MSQDYEKLFLEFLKFKNFLKIPNLTSSDLCENRKNELRVAPAMLAVPFPQIKHPTQLLDCSEKFHVIVET